MRKSNKLYITENNALTVSLDHCRNENTRLKTDVANYRAKLMKKNKNYGGASFDGKDPHNAIGVIFFYHKK